MPKTVHDLICNDDTWDFNLISKYVDYNSHNAINYVAINLNMHDRIRWNSTKNGELTTKSVYNFLTDLNIDKNEAKFWKQIWKLNVKPEVNMFCWKLVYGALALRHRMSKYVTTLNSFCLLCDSNAAEDECHLFVNCPFTRKIWDAFHLSDIYKLQGSYDVMMWFNYWMNSKILTEKHDKISYVIWSISKYRNNVNFDNVIPLPQKLVDSIKIYYQNKVYPSDNTSRHASQSLRNPDTDIHTNSSHNFDWFIPLMLLFLRIISQWVMLSPFWIKHEAKNNVVQAETGQLAPRC
ncbi:uncharacterized protein LOC113295124 [Papaver somniferum]|uniref:uncharacterized protein LOC113295124 n=1 Tax=Papaver somniferum TaxID=3469 RepID=UPI000E7023BE|nr:uncharacterized protein LOC113295124 [Papaver somniferum]